MPSLPVSGADVAMCLTGGLVRMSGHGERVVRAPEHAEFHVAVAVPPFELATADVYRRWDEMEGPTGDSDPRHRTFLPHCARTAR